MRNFKVGDHVWVLNKAAHQPWTVSLQKHELVGGIAGQGSRSACLKNYGWVYQSNLFHNHIVAVAEAEKRNREES